MDEASPGDGSHQLINAVYTTVFEDYKKDETIQNPEDEKMETSKRRDTWLKEFLQKLSQWLNAQQQSPRLRRSQEEIEKEEEMLWKDWEWVLSKAEEFVLQQSLNEAERIHSELMQLRKTAALLKFRPYYIQEAKRALVRLDREEFEDISSVLDASKRSKIITDVVMCFEDRWLVFIGDFFFQEGGELWENFQQNYRQQPYSRNVVGSLNELAFSASHGSKETGLDYRVLSEMLWSLWKSLSSSIQTHLQRNLEESELMVVAKEILPAREKLIQLWIDTVRKSRLGSGNEGNLVSKWNRANREEEKRIERIKVRGVDAKYQCIPWEQNTHFDLNIEELKSTLESKLSVIFGKQV